MILHCLLLGIWLLSTLLPALAVETEHVGNTTFKCNDGRQIPESWRCDGDFDCENEEDEKNCSNLCAANQFKCGTFPLRPEFKPTYNPCIPLNLKCNGEVDCEDQSDEANCDEVFRCSQEEFTCLGYKSQCIPKTWMCDGQRDCPISNDEYPCDYKKKCGDDQFKCENNICLPKKWVCDGYDDCGDASDEKGCPLRWLKRDENKKFEIFACENDYYNRKIRKEWECDGENDCWDGFDEKNCSKNVDFCSSDEFRCSNGLCILNSLKCDGNKDCTDGSDELDCAETHAPKCDDTRQFECPDMPHRCIDYTQLCKGNRTRYVCTDAATECNKSYKQCSSGSEGCKCHFSFIGRHEVCYCKDGWKTVRNVTDKSAVGWCVDIDECESRGSCDQLCTNKIGQYRCACGKGYRFSRRVGERTQRKCRAVGGDPLLILSEDSSSIRLYNIQMSYFDEMIENPGSVVSMDFHVANMTIFWCDAELNIIMMEDIDTKIRRFVITEGVPNSVAIDWAHNLLIWTNSVPTQINVMDLVTRRRKTLFDSDLVEPHDIAVDPELGLIFWIDSGKNTVERAGMDGNDRKVIVKGDVIKSPRGLALDYVLKRVYFMDSKLKSIVSCDYWGQDVNFVLHSSRISRPFSLTVFEDRVYYTDFDFPGVNSVNKFDGGDVHRFMKTVSRPTRPMAVKIFQKQMQPDIENKCQNSGCGDSLCLPRAVYLKQYKSQEKNWCGKQYACIPSEDQSHTRLPNSTTIFRAIVIICAIVVLCLSRCHQNKAYSRFKNEN